MHAFVDANQYVELPKEPQPWVIHGLVPIGGLVNVYGKPKTGKSFIVLDWCYAVSSGKPTWFGYKIEKPGPVCYLQVDTPREEWSRRIEGGLGLYSIADLPLYIADMWQVPTFPVNVLDPLDATLKWLKEEFERIQPVMVVIDTLREIHSGDEDNSTVMRNVISSLVGVARPAAVVLVSHARKDNAMMAQVEEDMMDQARGSSYVAGRMDVVVNVTQRRMKFKGRATGQQQETLVQDPETGWISIQRQDDGSDELLRTLHMEYPGLSVNAMAKKLAERQKFSLSTATRRVNSWREQEMGQKGEVA